MIHRDFVSTIQPRSPLRDLARTKEKLPSGAPQRIFEGSLAGILHYCPSSSVDPDIWQTPRGV